jgi:DNA-directed RNA polymerase subunit beta'
VVESLRERILGSREHTELINPESGHVMYPANTLLDEDAVEAIEAVGLDEIRVRTPLTCETRYGLCAICYGRDLGRGSDRQRLARRWALSPRSRSASRARS